MNDGVVLAVALIIIAFVPGDLYVALRLLKRSSERPLIPSLALWAGSSTGIAIASVLSAIVALAVAYYVVTEDVILSGGVALLLLVVARFVLSLPNLFAWRQLRRWDGER